MFSWTAKCNRLRIVAVRRSFRNTSVSAVKVHIVKWSIYLDQRKMSSVYGDVAEGKLWSGRVEQNKKTVSFVNQISRRSFGLWRIHASACLPAERIYCTEAYRSDGRTRQTMADDTDTTLRFRCRDSIPGVLETRKITESRVCRKIVLARHTIVVVTIGTPGQRSCAPFHEILKYFSTLPSYFILLCILLLFKMFVFISLFSYFLLFFFFSFFFSSESLSME